jgi:hypothetical protein
MANVVRLCIVLAAGWLALMFGLSSIWLGSAASIGFGCLWLLGRETRRDESAMAGLVVFTILSVVGLFQNLPDWSMLLEVIGVLATWDLHLFESRLAYTSRIENSASLIRAHLQRLALIVILSLVLGGLGIGIDLQLNLLAAVGLGGLTVLLLTRILRQNR